MDTFELLEKLIQEAKSRAGRVYCPQEGQDTERDFNLLNAYLDTIQETIDILSRDYAAIYGIAKEIRDWYDGGWSGELSHTDVVDRFLLCLSARVDNVKSTLTPAE